MASFAAIREGAPVRIFLKAEDGIRDIGVPGVQTCALPISEGRVPLATLLDYLPPETIFLLCEPESLAVHADAYAQRVPAADPFFISWPDFLIELNRRGFTSAKLDRKSTR